MTRCPCPPLGGVAFTPGNWGPLKEKVNTMQERVTAQENEMFDVVIQFGPDLNLLGLGLETRAGGHHFVDSVYGSPENLQKIGELFHERMADLGLRFEGDPMTTVSGEAYRNIGRAILDSVTGSTPADGLWTWLGRPASNRLIRLIRKGRDTSFGRDE